MSSDVINLNMNSDRERKSTMIQWTASSTGKWPMDSQCLCLLADITSTAISCTKVDTKAKCRQRVELQQTGFCIYWTQNNSRFSGYKKNWTASMKGHPMAWLGACMGPRQGWKRNENLHLPPARCHFFTWVPGRPLSLVTQINILQSCTAPHRPQQQLVPQHSGALPSLANAFSSN